MISVQSLICRPAWRLGPTNAIASGDQLCLAISGESSQASRTLAIWFRNDTLPLISTQPYKLPTVSFILKQIVGYNRSSPDHAPDARIFGEFESY
jgi:hypothetical protein